MPIHSWYAAAAIALTALIQILKSLPGIAPIWDSPRFAGWRFLVPLVLGAATAAVGAMTQGLPIGQVLLAALSGVLGIGATASGAAAWLRESPVPWSGGSGGKAAALAAILLCCVACTPAQVRAVNTALSDVAVGLADANTVLDDIESISGLFFAAKPDPAAQARVEAAIQKARVALTVAARTAQGAKQLDQAHVESAFQDFRAAYSDLGLLLGKEGIAAMGPDGAVQRLPTKFGARQAGSEQTKIPAPLALSLRIHP